MYPDPVAAWAQQRPDQVAVWTRLRAVSYRELDDLTARAARTAADVAPPGGLVGLVAQRTLDFIAGVWGITRAGRVLLPLDPDLPGGVYARHTVRFGMAALTEPQQLVAAEPGTASPAAAGEPYAVVLTSGSRGEPKGAVLTWANIAAAAQASAARLGTDADDGWLAALPVHHIGGLSIIWRSAIAGSTVVLESGFDAAVCADLMGEEATVASLVPTMLRRILASSDRRWKGMRAVLVGGAAADAALLAAARHRGLPALATYGLTEAASQVATEDPAAADGTTAGRPLDGLDVRINGEGRIEISGDAVFAGYWGSPPRRGKWFTTGDLGEILPDGRLRVLGRADEVIVTGGHKVHPVAVEAVLSAHPGVVEAAVYGVADDEWGELVAAAVVTTGRVGADELEELCRRQLVTHQVPRRWSFVADLPRTTSGKVDRVRLAAR